MMNLSCVKLMYAKDERRKGKKWHKLIRQIITIGWPKGVEADGKRAIDAPGTTGSWLTIDRTLSLRQQ
jgi:hypothetical protein